VTFTKYLVNDNGILHPCNNVLLITKHDVGWGERGGQVFSRGTAPLPPHVELPLNARKLTSVDEASWRAFAELFRFERQRHFDDTGDVSRRRVNFDSVRRYQLTTTTTTTTTTTRL